MAYIAPEKSHPVDLAWREGKMAFDETPLSDVAKMIQRHYGVEVKITNDALAKETFRGNFDGEPMEDVLNSLQIVGDFQYRKEGGAIVIY